MNAHFGYIAMGNDQPEKLAGFYVQPAEYATTPALLVSTPGAAHGSAA